MYCVRSKPRTRATEGGPEMRTHQTGVIGPNCRFLPRPRMASHADLIVLPTGEMMPSASDDGRDACSQRYLYEESRE